MNPDLPDYSRSRAILIGTSTYQDTEFPPLPTAANSLVGFREALTNPHLCGWPSERISFLPNPVAVPQLVKQLRRLAEATEDVLLVYFVGHGTMNDLGQLCLVLSDTDFTDPDVTGLEYSRVSDALKRSPARMRVVILDCCYSGRAIEAQASSASIADSTAVQGIYTMTASDHTAHTPALGPQQAAFTSFTGELLGVIRAGVEGGPEKLTLGLIYRHVRRRLQMRRLPAPNHRGTDTADLYAFTMNAAYQDEGPPISPTLSVRPQPGFAVTIPAGHTKSVNSVAFSPDGAFLASGGQDCRIQLWDVANALSIGTRIGQFPIVHSVAFSPDGAILASGGRDSRIRLFDVGTSQKIGTLVARPGIGLLGYIWAVAFSPDGTLLAGVGGRRIRLWDTRTGRHTATFSGHAAISVAFSPNGALLASGCRDKTIRLWDVETGRNIATLAGHTGVVHSVAFSPDEAILASGGDGTVRLWDLETARNTTTFNSITDNRLFHSVNSITFSPDGAILASGGDKTVRLWDVQTGRNIATLTGHTDTVQSVAFSPEGSLLASGSKDKAIRLWKV
jgi:WD40 repeat protein